jgi:hypothetical protein
MIRLKLAPDADLASDCVAQTRALLRSNHRLLGLRVIVKGRVRQRYLQLQARIPIAPAALLIRLGSKRKTTVCRGAAASQRGPRPAHARGTQQVNKRPLLTLAACSAHRPVCP